MKSKDLYPGLTVALRPSDFASSVTLRLIVSGPDGRGRFRTTKPDGSEPSYPRDILPQQVIPAAEAEQIVAQRLAQREEQRQFRAAREAKLDLWKARYGVGWYGGPVESYITGESTDGRLSLKVHAPEHIIARIAEILRAEEQHHINQNGGGK